MTISEQIDQAYQDILDLQRRKNPRDMVRIVPLFKHLRDLQAQEAVQIRKNYEAEFGSITKGRDALARLDKIIEEYKAKGGAMK